MVTTAKIRMLCCWSPEDLSLKGSGAELFTLASTWRYYCATLYTGQLFYWYIGYSSLCISPSGGIGPFRIFNSSAKRQRLTYTTFSDHPVHFVAPRNNLPQMMMVVKYKYFGMADCCFLRTSLSSHSRPATTTLEYVLEIAPF